MQQQSFEYTVLNVIKRLFCTLPRLVEANQCCKGCMSLMNLIQHWLQSMLPYGSSLWQPITLREGFSKLANQRVHLDACRPDACPKLYILLGVGGCISDHHLPWLHLIHLHCHQHLLNLSPSLSPQFLMPILSCIACFLLTLPLQVRS